MENTLLFALQISGIGIAVLLLILAALAGVVYLMTRFITDRPEKVEVTEEPPPPAAGEVEGVKPDLRLAAAVALAIARAQTETQSMEMESEISAGAINSWRQYGLHRRLTQSSTIRRTR